MSWTVTQRKTWHCTNKGSAYLGAIFVPKRVERVYQGPLVFKLDTIGGDIVSDTPCFDDHPLEKTAG